MSLPEGQRHSEKSKSSIRASLQELIARIREHRFLPSTNRIGGRRELLLGGLGLAATAVAGGGIGAALTERQH